MEWSVLNNALVGYLLPLTLWLLTMVKRGISTPCCSHSLVVAHSLADCESVENVALLRCWCCWCYWWLDAMPTATEERAQINSIKHQDSGISGPWPLPMQRVDAGCDAWAFRCCPDGMKMVTAIMAIKASWLGVKKKGCKWVQVPVNERECLD